MVVMFLSAVMTTFIPVVVQNNSFKDNSFNSPYILENVYKDIFGDLFIR